MFETQSNAAPVQLQLNGAFFNLFAPQVWTESGIKVFHSAASSAWKALQLQLIISELITLGTFCAPLMDTKLKLFQREVVAMF